MRIQYTRFFKLRANRKALLRLEPATDAEWAVGWEVAKWVRATMVAAPWVGKAVAPLLLVVATAAPPAAHIAVPRKRWNKREKTRWRVQK